jgi:hypothetical protein
MKHAAHKHKNGKKQVDTRGKSEIAAPLRQESRSASPQTQSTDNDKQDKQYESVARDIAQLIQKHPIPAIALGIGLGFVFARLMRS